MDGDFITFKNGKLVVPNNPVIPFIEGDGIGSDIWNASKLVFDAAVQIAYQGKKKIMWKEVFIGEKAVTKLGEYLPQVSLDEIKSCLVAIKGPLTTPVSGGFRSLNVALRQNLDLYACVRPVRWFEGVPSPIKEPQNVDMIVFRENTEDIYAGIEWMSGTPECIKVIDFLQNQMGINKIRFPESSSIGVKPVSREGTERIVKAAIEYAFKNNKNSITIVHKGNIMKFTEGMFRNWGYDFIKREYGERVYLFSDYENIISELGVDAANSKLRSAISSKKLIVKDVIADSFFQQILLRPKEYSVIATLNLNGDYISDALAAMVGGIGIAPGANINYETGNAIFEATHGSAPKYAGLDKVNPSSLLLSGVMMLEYIGWNEAADLIIKGVEKTIKSGKVTYDLERQMKNATLVKCSEFCKILVTNFYDNKSL